MTAEIKVPFCEIIADKGLRQQLKQEVLREKIL